MNAKHVPMPITRRAVAIGAVLLFLANLLFLGIAGGIWSKFLYALLALVALFPIDHAAGLWRLFSDTRPAPANHGTAITLDPREGHAESAESHLIGRVIERRRL